MKIYITLLPKSVFIFLALLISPTAIAGLAEGQQELRIHMGDPGKKGESIISVSANWNNPLGWITASTSLVIANGSDRKHPDDAASMAKKTTKAIKVSMIAHDPNMRGLNIVEEEGAGDSQVVIKNNQDNEINQLILRDYTNQKFRIESGGSSFSGAGVKVSMDVVEAGAVDHVDQFVPQPKNKSKFLASGGGIEISIGGKKAETIETEKRSLEDIEKSIASAVAGKFSSSPLIADQKERDTRNIKPFDGGEVQFAALSDKSFTINVNDPSLGIITKYRFPGAKSASAGSSSSMMWIVILLLAAAGGYYYYTTTTRKDDAEENVEE